MATDRLYTVLDDVPDHIREMPGVYHQKHGRGYRVPYNVFPLMDMPLPPAFTVGEKCVEAALNNEWIKPETRTRIRPHQKKPLAHALSRTGSHIWAPPGAGKTLMGCAYLAWSVKGFGPRVVITKAAARSTWQEEVEKWTNWTPILLVGQKPDADIVRMVHSDDPSLVFITAWETLTYWQDTLAEARPCAVVMDEIHMAKQHKRVKPVVTKEGETVWESLDNLTAAASVVAKASARRLGLTATPIPNKVKDLWAQLDLCEPWQYGPFSKFGVAYCDGHHNGYGMEYNGYSNGEELTSRLKFSKHRVSNAQIANDLPPKRRQITRLTRDQQDFPEAGFARDIRKAAKDEDNEALHEVLLQEAATRKRKYVIGEVVDALRAGMKVVVFTGRRRDCDVLGEAIRKAAPTEATVWVAHGGHSEAFRDNIRWEYMGNEAKGIKRHAGPCALVGTGDVWGESVNLQDTDIAFYVQLPWTPRQIRQREGRFNRMGGTRAVLHRYIVALGTVDEDVADNLLGKLPPVVDIVQDEELDGMEQEFRPRSTGDLLARMQAIAQAKRDDDAEETTRAQGEGSSSTPAHGPRPVRDAEDEFFEVEI